MANAPIETKDIFPSDGDRTKQHLESLKTATLANPEVSVQTLRSLVENKRDSMEAMAMPSSAKDREILDTEKGIADRKLELLMQLA